MGQRHVHPEVNMFVVMAGKAITQSTDSIALLTPTHKCCSLEVFLSFYLRHVLCHMIAHFVS